MAASEEKNIRRLKIYGETDFSWTARKTLDIQVASASNPDYADTMLSTSTYEANGVFLTLLDLMGLPEDTNALKGEVLAEGNNIILRVSGEKAVEAARTIRDKVYPNFFGVASIPDAPGRTAS
jgi:hypothetical protein